METDTQGNKAKEVHLPEELAEAIYKLIEDYPWRLAAAGAVIALNRRSIRESGLVLQISSKSVVEGCWE